VCLRHSPGKQRSSSSNDEAESSSHTDTPSSLAPLHGKNSSGESSNAEKWFEQSNNQVRDTSASFADNDPPFFMRNSSSETPPDRQPQLLDLLSDDRADSLPLRTGLLELGTEGSSTEDFRSVIDDLTVENKRLKRRLKKYEKLHDSHLKDEKLFEVRIHGLPPEKKRELEETLRKFASDLDTTGANAFPTNGYASLMPLLKRHKTSSPTSLQNTDSAYASMSASGRGSSARSGNDAKNHMTPASHLASRQQNIHNYLHDIPKGLLPRENPATLSDKAKKKLVVRRMEQLFAGKGAAAMGHQQSLQQQEVSQSAAKADRTSIKATGQRASLDGNRGAYIMEQETEDALDQRQDKGGDQGVDESLKPIPPSVRENRSPDREQRPTRPLDLDPHRAQVPAENIQYMRNLGFSPRDPKSLLPSEDGHGWIYLNFLINMAQLHTINVTSDFVRKSLNELSDKFEISDDLRMVRWRGGPSVTRTSSNCDGSSNDRAGDNTPEGQSPRKRVKLSHQASVRSNAPSGLRSARVSKRHHLADSKHIYTPIFFHRHSTDDTDDSSSEAGDESMPSPFPAPVAGDSSGMASSGIRTTFGMPLPAAKKPKQKNDDGPIIFYNNARFCTDLSGDRRPAGKNDSAPAYTPASSIPIGKSQKVSEVVPEKRGPLAQATELPEPMDLGDNPIPESMELSFPQRSPVGFDSPKEQEPIHFEVTGIGGVWPTDNFAISVNSRHTIVDQPEAPAIANGAFKALPRRLAEILHGPDAEPKVRAAMQKELIATKVQKLPPSELPEALSFMPFGDDTTNDDDDESDVDDMMSDVPESTGDPPPSAAPQPVDLRYLSEDEGYDDDDEDDDEDDGDEESDGEVDFLAAAREIDPEAVRQKEREYDANMAERLAEKIPTGSSAATAGGGSGFASLSKGTTLEEHQRAS
jgi:hypothetical protein